MSLRRVGFFRELRHGRPDGPSLTEAPRAPLEDMERVVHYLEHASALAVTGVMVDDCLDPSRKRVARLEIATDGAWVWPRDLAYYVRTYGVGLPDELVEHMRARSWEPPDLTLDELTVIEAEYLGRREDG